MSETTTKTYISYRGLQQQRILLAALVLGLVAVFVGILLEVYYRGAQATQISPVVRQLAKPLNPVLNTEVLSKLDAYEQLSLEQIKGMFALTSPAQTILERLEQAQQVASAEADIIQQAIDANTLAEEEILSTDDLNSLLEDSESTQEAQLAE